MTPREARQALRDLPTWAKVGGIVGSIAVGGMVFGRDWAGLPAQVEANTKAVSEHDRILRELVDGQERIVCILTLPDSVRPLEAERRCR